MKNNAQLFDQINHAFCACTLSRSTQKAYLDWIYRYTFYHQQRDPAEMYESEVVDFLNFLSNQCQVAASTQNQAYQAVLFLYREVLGRPLKKMAFDHAPKHHRLPVIFSSEEVRAVLGQLRGEAWLMASLLYGCGLLVHECVQLRIKDLNFEGEIILAGDGITEKCRHLVLPQTLHTPLKTWIQGLFLTFKRYQREGWCGVSLPESVEQACPGARWEWAWQYLFPSSYPSAYDDQTRRHHRSESFLEKAVKAAIRSAGIEKTANCCSFRHSFAVHLLEEGYDMRVVMRLLGHRNTRSTKIYTRLMENKFPRVVSPLDRLKIEY